MKKSVSKKSLYSAFVWVLALLGGGLIVYRFIYGIGAVSNLSDEFPWGLWIGVDILAGVALAAGGFVVAGAVHLFGKKELHSLSRPAILTALLGYMMFMVGLLVDLGRPWNVFEFIFNGNHDSPLYEVGLCVMFYTVVLILEVMPMVFERFKMEGARDTWYSLTPWVITLMVTLFIYAMSHNMIWSLILAGIFIFWEVCMRINLMPRDKQMPILMILAGVIFSTLHQSSLGTIYLMMPHDLHVLWYSPWLPILFLMSAILVGPAMVVFESLSSEKVTGHEPDMGALISLSKAMPFLLTVYMVLKFSDLFFRGDIVQAFIVNNQSISWWMEMIVGVFLPLILYLHPTYCSQKGGLLLTSSLVVTGLIWNRINVSIVGIQVGSRWGTYYPHWNEIFITIGIFAAGLLVFKALSNQLILSKH